MVIIMIRRSEIAFDLWNCLRVLVKRRIKFCRESLMQNKVEPNVRIFA